MSLTRRAMLKSTALGALAAAAPLEAAPQQQGRLPEVFDRLKPLGDRVKPVTDDEFKARIANAQRLMAESKPQFSALFLTPSTSLYYYTGLRWGGGERLFAVVIPQKGDPFLVCPGFEEGRARELPRWPMEVRVWQEDESPYALVAKTLAERGHRIGRVAINEATPFFFYDGLRKAAPGLECASGDPITAGCRMKKSAHEIELMMLANHATVDCFRAVFASLHEGITQSEVSAMVSGGFRRMGLNGGGLVLFGEWAALPHGTTKPQQLKPGDGVLIDAGTSVEGYSSDVTRTGCLGKPSDKLRRAFDAVRKAQDAALAAAQKGKPCGGVDDAARAAIVGAGYPANYGVLTHRLGHGIGLDGHEWPYLVRGNKLPLEASMSFSNEPGIYVKGDYGLRCEDIMVIEENGPARLLTPGFAPSIENPCG
ncbi:MAG: aminopeptidase P family protein [Acidobacteria bacterium]|nr:aminopeptidase P family protein [Acidobacteriota bacterium]